ncbi:MAG: 4Fe-4S binding protein [candidate division KSB1 bacterium]|nr:4Fe-4S binding protein [candidate division KSB1 bacterium]MDZ7275581.1 4Fe-4S binding protein [candidate division KSB1 bacterium]MDZ7284728.1 4Fe-4S binding protein [candidate division KSB1 bacterium]MDZ7297853.1 4Fe-4S binding protein [candidate division KSB1 bacterium]MDZ7308755.1 4Fe-4S binding protein [candidate division KSB1 bacterium]
MLKTVQPVRENTASGPQVPRRKIPPEARRLLRAPAQLGLRARWWWRLRYDSQFLRRHLQIAFAALVIWIGVEFVLFVRWLESGGVGPAPERPPGVEGFLPLSGLISLKHWWLTGSVNLIHPAALFILLAILTLGVLLQKSFCGWLCPIGLLSELHWKLGRRLFGGNLRVPKWLDWPLRALKYLLLGFFLYAIFWQMDLPALTAFINSPYNQVADIKMLYFFEHIDRTTLRIIGVIALLSLPVKNFWCRYLCPYGALLGAGSLLSPVKITRNPERCIDCSLCTKACPANIKVHQVKRVYSDECMACLACARVCPVKDTLDLCTIVRGQRVPAPVLAALITGLFVAVTGAAMLAGLWQNSISHTEYLRHLPRIESYGHPGR